MMQGLIREVRGGTSYLSKDRWQKWLHSGGNKGHYSPKQCPEERHEGGNCYTTEKI